MKVFKVLSAAVSIFLGTSAFADCKVGVNPAENTHPIVVSKTADAKYVIKAKNEGDSSYLGVFVTEPAASLPKGPFGKLKGKNYWSINLKRFPKAFSGPIVYREVPSGAVESTAKYGGEENGTKLSEIPAGTCLKFSIVHYPSFKTSSYFVEVD